VFFAPSGEPEVIVAADRQQASLAGFLVAALLGGG
jgi:hypothetical protein